ncbi:hypothetical protein DFJ74DRAFT_656849, partial [Hyaloraphidium curvatum]
MAYCWSWFGNWTRMDPPVHGLGYVWEPDPRCSDFETTMDREAVCAALGSRPLMLVGDSITRQHYEYLNRTLGSDQRLPPLRVTPKSWDPEPDPSIVPHIQGLPYRDAICNGSEIRYLRADRLLMDGNPARALQGWAIDMRWTEQIRHYKGIVIMNRGAHPEQDERLLDEVRVAFGYVRGAAPHALQFWRTTPPGHAGCGGIKEPLAEVQPGEGLPYSWGTFWNQSKLVVDLINGEYPSVLPLDVSLPTGLKGDGHTDCLHYSNDDPYAYWTFLLVNMLKRLDAKARPARALWQSVASPCQGGIHASVAGTVQSSAPPRRARPLQAQQVLLNTCRLVLSMSTALACTAAVLSTSNATHALLSKAPRHHTGSLALACPCPACPGCAAEKTTYFAAVRTRKSTSAASSPRPGGRCSATSIDMARSNLRPGSTLGTVPRSCRTPLTVQFARSSGSTTTSSPSGTPASLNPV